MECDCVKSNDIEVRLGIVLIDVRDIPPGTPHGFTIAPDGYLAFLSVQSPPIERPDGADDYHRVAPGRMVHGRWHTPDQAWDHEDCP